MRLNFRTYWILIIKILFLSVAIYSIQNSISHQGRVMNSEELTSIGLNSFYFIDYDSMAKIDISKIMFLSTVTLTYYALTIAKFNNFYEGLKETIRIKSSSLYDYINKTIRFFTVPILIDIIISAIVISLLVLFTKAEHGLSFATVQNIILTSTFYSVMPFLLLFIVNRIEFFLVGVFTLSFFADYFVYKLPLVSIAVLYLAILVITYEIVLLRERRA